MIPLPKRGELIKADWAKKITDSVNKNHLSLGQGLSGSTGANGTSITLSGTPRGRDFDDRRSHPFKISFNRNEGSGTDIVLDIYLPSGSLIYNGTDIITQEWLDDAEWEYVELPNITGDENMPSLQFESVTNRENLLRLQFDYGSISSSGDEEYGIWCALVNDSSKGVIPKFYAQLEFEGEAEEDILSSNDVSIISKFKIATILTEACTKGNTSGAICHIYNVIHSAVIINKSNQGCFELTITDDGDDNRKYNFSNCYYQTGSIISECEGCEEESSDDSIFFYLEITPDIEISQAEIKNCQEIYEFNSEQYNNVDKVLVPLYWVKNGTIAVDFRLMPYTGIIEFFGAQVGLSE